MLRRTHGWQIQILLSLNRGVVTLAASSSSELSCTFLTCKLRYEGDVESLHTDMLVFQVPSRPRDSASRKTSVRVPQYAKVVLMHGCRRGDRG